MLHGIDANIIRSCLLMLCTLHVINVCNAQWFHMRRNLTRHTRQASGCSSNQFKCGSGECIDETNECDGKQDCQDSSDETNRCRDIIPCNSRLLFQCNYGACISRELHCNGKKDCIDNSDETNCQNSNPTSSPSAECGLGKFDCDSGQCIPDDLLCDGKPDCPQDSSDETSKVCSQLQCPRLTFRCKYGACVSQDAKCNKVKDCLDGSDEQNCSTTSSTSTEPVIPLVIPTPSPTKPTDGSCQIPRNPSFGEFFIGENRASSYPPGSYTQAFSALRLECGRRHKPSPPTQRYSVCFSGKWDPPPQVCVRACRSIKSTNSTKFKCKLGNVPLDTCDDPIENTIASITCEPYFEYSQSLSPTRICRDGSWDYPVTECLPVCGIKRPKGVTNIINGTVVSQGDYPWHVGIYYSENKQHICGGSILNPKVVLSAAHCFTNIDGAPYPPEKYLIAAGKYYRKYDDEKDEKAQFATINTIHVPERYKGVEASYAYDIAVIVLNNQFKITMTVQPVCVDWSNNYEYQQLSENNKGVVVGWGYTQVGKTPSEELKELSVPYIPYDRCYDQIPPDFRRFLTFDKVCAGFLHKGTAVCQGDSGGGLAFSLNDRYIIRGVVSTSPSTENSCDPNQYATYTLVSKHLEFIRDIETINRP